MELLVKREAEVPLTGHLMGRTLRLDALKVMHDGQAGPLCSNCINVKGMTAVHNTDTGASGGTRLLYITYIMRAKHVEVVFLVN